MIQLKMHPPGMKQYPTEKHSKFIYFDEAKVTCSATLAVDLCDFPF